MSIKQDAYIVVARLSNQTKKKDTMGGIGTSNVIQSGQVEYKTLMEPTYSSKEWQPPGEWWKNHILLQLDEECANVTSVGDPSSVKELGHEVE